MNRVLRRSFLGGAFLALLGIGCAIPFFFSSNGEQGGLPSAPKRFKRQLGDGFQLSRHGLYGVNLIECGKCSIEKKKNGIFTFGAFNVLVLEDLKIVLPPQTNRAESAGGVSISECVSAKAVLEGMGVDCSFLRGRGGDMRFSELKVNGLTLSRLVDGRIVPAFTARSGESVRSGLRLSGCTVFDGAMTNLVTRAVLKVRPRLRLDWPGGGMNLP